MAKKLKLINQYECGDETLQLAFIGMADLIDEEARTIIWNTYRDQALTKAYQDFRQVNTIRNGFTKHKTAREIVRIPAGHVYHFLKSQFEPFYGQKWLQNKKVLRHELMRPWWVVNKI